MSATMCAYCGTPRTGDEPWCARCFMPFQATTPGTVEPQPAAAPTAAPLADVPATVEPAPAYAGGGAEPPAAPADPRFSWNGLTPGQPAPAPDPMMFMPSPALNSSGPSLGLVAAAVVVFVALVGGVLGWYLLHGPNDKSAIAAQFRSGKPAISIPGLVGPPPVSPSDVPDTTANAAAVLSQVDADIRAANADIVNTEAAFDRWADGKMSDRELIQATSAFSARMAARASEFGTASDQAPSSLALGLGHLASAASSYHTALGELSDYLLSHARASRLTYWIGVADANEEWDNGLTGSYTAAGLAPPASPHKH